MANSPTIVLASLDDDKLKQSINSLVQHVNDGMQAILNKTNSTVDEMQRKLQSLGSLKVDSGSSVDGGASKRTKAQNTETTAVEQTIAARDKQIKKNKEVEASYDKMANAQQVAIRSSNPNAIRNADTLQTMNIQLDLLRERLREARNQYSSFIALAAHATTTGDKGLFQFATEGVHRYGDEVRNIIPQIRAMQSSIQQMGDVIAPQGHTIQNFVNSLQKTNPELAQLNAQYKSGTSLLHEQASAMGATVVASDKVIESIRKQAQAIRESQQWKEKGWVTIGDQRYYDPERANVTKRERQLLLSLEEQLLQVQQKEAEEAQKTAEAKKQQAQAAKEETQAKNTVSAKDLGIDPHISAGRLRQTAGTSAAAKETEYLRQQVASLLEVEQREIHTVNTQIASYSQLAQYLKHLQSAYQRLGADRIARGEGADIANEIQRVQRAMQQLQQTMSRPVDLKSALSLPEKTLDDMAYKMRQLAAYRGSLDVKTQVDEINQVNKKYAELQKNMNDIMKKNSDMIASNTALGRSWNYMKNRLAFYFTVGASTQFVKNLINIRGQYELLERSIGILFDSMQTGTKIFSELNAMAIKSPFTTMELGAAAKQLSAYNIAAKDVVDTTRRLADIAAAVGVPIERLTYALGQIKSYGYLNSRDARMFANAGIPLIQNLADMYTKLEGRLVSIGDVYDRIKKKQISFEDTLKVINEMTDEGGRFFNFQEKAADTLVVRLANLTLAWNNMLNNIGKSNQGILTSGLGILKDIFENWRKIDNLIWSIVSVLGVAKGLELIILLNAKGITKEMALQTTLGMRLGSMVYGIARSLKMLAVNPMTWVSAAIIGVTYLGWKFWDLSKANENLNKSIANNTKENIESIDKFFDRYRKDVESVGSMNTTDQSKMWERIREEIEKTSKNAQQYIDILEKIPDVGERVAKASGFIEQEKVIQEEINRLAQHGYFNVGGGFADESYASSLVAIDKYTSEMIRKYGTYGDYIKAFKDEFQGFYDEARNLKFSWDINEEIEESIKHFQKLENLNWDRILMGGTAEEKLARIRDAFISVRDNFFATEEMQNAGAEAQARYNRHMDYWITSIAKARGVIKDLTVDGQTFAAADVAAVEERRTEWEMFFSYLSEEEKRTMDYLVKTNQTGSDEFKKIWDNATKSMQKSNTTAYLDLKNKIEELRNTPDIVINVVYRELRDKLDEQQKEFERRWIAPKNFVARNLSAEDYMEEETANRTKYGRLMRKQDEDNVDWEERLGKEYQENAKKIKSLNDQLSGKAKLEKADKDQVKADLDLYTDLNKAIKDIGDAHNFNFDQFKKGGKGGSKKDPVLDALKQEIQLVEKLQNDYDKLSKSGASQADALATIRGAYGTTIKQLNTKLGAYGLPELTTQLITGKDPNKALEHFKKTLNDLVSKGMLTLERSKELEAVVEKFTISAKSYNLDMVTKGLNNELGKLKDEYELAVELDANPELGNMFADFFGINLDELPKDYEQALKLAQKRINTMLKESPDVGIASIDIEKLMSRSEFDSWVKSLGKDASSELIKGFSDVRSWLYKVRSDETKKQIQEWDKMLEKYAEYEYKRAQIDKEYEREIAIARKKNASDDILKAIENRRKERYAELDFNEFMKTPEWITATGNLADMSKAAIGMLIDRINEYKRTAKYLSPKQIKEMNKALKQLHAEQRKNNPFKAISTMLAEAKERMDNFKTEIQETEEEIDQLTDAIDKGKEEGKDTSKQEESLIKLRERLEDLKATKEKLGKLDASGWIGAINETVTAVKAAVGVFDDLAKAIGGVNNSDVDKAFGVLEKAGSSAATGAAIGGAWGAVIGAVVGAASSIISWVAGSANESINNKIKSSERAVKRLENAMKDLEDTAEHTYGTMESGTKRVVIANKQLQLEELKRQIQLEKSRDGKNKDKDKIIELEGQYKELLLEIKNGIEDVVNEMLGISSAGDAATQLVEAMVDAFKNGEDAMQAFSDKWDEMIDNMILKLIVNEYLKKVWDNVMQNLNKKEEEYLAKSSADKAQAQAELDKYENMSEQERAKEYALATGRMDWYKYNWNSDYVGEMSKQAEAYMSALRQRIAAADAANEQASEDYLKWSLDYMMGEGRKEMEDAAQNLLDGLGEWYAFGQDKDSALSALQQGIQGITEDTASALEAYMNGVSQQVYLQSDILTQIRDAVVGMDMDIQVATQAQMLLQLQNSYQTQQAIQQILESVLVPSGRAFAVELAS